MPERALAVAALWVTTSVLGAGSVLSDGQTPPPAVLLLPLDSTGSDCDETSFGALVADSARSSAGTDVAIVASDEFVPKRFEAGKHTLPEIVGALRNTNDKSDDIVVLKLTGEQLTLALDRSVSREPSPFEGFLQVSGLAMVWSASHTSDARVMHLTVRGVTVDGARTYTVATTASLADGGLGYFRVWSDSDVARRTDVTLSQSVTQYLTANSVPNMLTGGRIIKEE